MDAQVQCIDLAGQFAGLWSHARVPAQTTAATPGVMTRSALGPEPVPVPTQPQADPLMFH